jgi:hypothetical protein
MFPGPCRAISGWKGGGGILKNMEHRHQYFYYKNVGDGRGGGGGNGGRLSFAKIKRPKKISQTLSCYNEGLKILFHTFFRPQCFLIFLNI